jgi:hypothetical protein
MSFGNPLKDHHRHHDLLLLSQTTKAICSSPRMDDKAQQEKPKYIEHARIVRKGHFLE